MFKKTCYDLHNCAWTTYFFVEFDRKHVIPDHWAEITQIFTENNNISHLKFIWFDMQQAPNGVVRHLNISLKTTMRIGNPQLVTYWKWNGLYCDRGGC